MKAAGGYMGLRLVALSVLVLASFWWFKKLEASSFTQGILQSASKNNENSIFRYLRPVLKSSGKVGRIYYRSTCQSDDNYSIPFPKISVQSPSKGGAGLAAVRDIFHNDKDVNVTEGRSGTISIRIGKIPDAILDTRISLLTLDPIAQYNYPFAFVAMENSKEVRAAMLKHGIRVSSIPINAIMVQPAEGLPHLPSSITNVTMDQALDLVARTFGGVVTYGACTEPCLYRIDFTGGVYFVDSKLRDGSGLK